MKSILSVIGARPQFIKCAPVSREIRKYFKEIIVHTGQHYDHNMSEIFFKLLNIPKPNYNLNVGSDSHAVQTSKIIMKLEKIMLKEKPDLVLLYGDTNSTLAGAVTAAKLMIPIAHVEAGLRSFNKSMPEELNRICTDHFSNILFCPGSIAVGNLKNEGIINNVYNTGDVMKDAVLSNISKIKLAYIKNKFGITDISKYYFMTIHRQENTDNLERLKRILKIAASAKNKVLFSIHPRTEKIIKNHNLKLSNNIIPLKPVNYLESLVLQKSSIIVLTDSGGIQKEAYFLSRPCITFRNETEWTETVKHGFNAIVDVNLDKFKSAERKFLDNLLNYKMYKLYGDGKASVKLTRILNGKI